MRGFKLPKEKGGVSISGPGVESDVSGLAKGPNRRLRVQAEILFWI